MDDDDPQCCPNSITVHPVSICPAATSFSKTTQETTPLSNSWWIVLLSYSKADGLRQKQMKTMFWRSKLEFLWKARQRNECRKKISSSVQLILGTRGECLPSGCWFNWIPNKPCGKSLGHEILSSPMKSEVKRKRVVWGSLLRSEKIIQDNNKHKWFIGKRVFSHSDDRIN